LMDCAPVIVASRDTESIIALHLLV
jgi:hypothetical protein